MTWYYVMNGAQQGPVSAEEMQRWLGQGVITGETLVWNASMTEWQPLSTTELGKANGTLPGQERCIVSGRLAPISEMFQTEHGWVSAESKEKYYQCLREGVAPQQASGASLTAWRDGKHMVIPLRDAVLPSRCVKTNAPVMPNEFRAKKLYWVHWGVLVAFVIVRWLGLILYFVLRKKVEVALPVSPAAVRSVRLNLAIAWGLVLVGLATIFGAVALGSVVTDAWIIVLGVVLLLAGAVLGVWRGRLVRVAKIKGQLAWVGGLHEDFLAALPPFQG